MSATNAEGNCGPMSRCASCGVKESDDVKLKDCGACHLVRYCGVTCQKQHRPKHKKACKERVAKLRDEVLFKQPESSHLGDCPICFLPLSLVAKKSALMTCCGKIICAGCSYAHNMYSLEEGTVHKCPFCRKQQPSTAKETKKRLTERAEMNDPHAIFGEGRDCANVGDYKSAFKYYLRAAKLGHATSHYNLSIMYQQGEGVEKDKAKELYHTEQAAIAGHPTARHNLGVLEWNAPNNQLERAVKHWMIGAKLGCDESLEKLKMAYKAEVVSKDDFAVALRAHQAAVDETKSPQRDEAEPVMQVMRARAGYVESTDPTSRRAAGAGLA